MDAEKTLDWSLLQHGLTLGLDIRNGRLHLCGSVDEALTEKAFQALSLASAFEYTRPLQILINSPGGDITQAFALIELIRTYAPTAWTIGVGEVYSGGLIVLQAGAKRLAYPSASFLLHTGEISVEGTPTDAAEFKQESDRLDEIAIALYTARAKVTKRKIVNLLKKDSYFGAEKALELGLIDTIVTPDSRSAEQPEAAR